VNRLALIRLAQPGSRGKNNSDSTVWRGICSKSLIEQAFCAESNSAALQAMLVIPCRDPVPEL
jgi:hypothetical protein